MRKKSKGASQSEDHKRSEGLRSLSDESVEDIAGGRDNNDRHKPPRFAATDMSATGSDKG